MAAAIEDLAGREQEAHDALATLAKIEVEHREAAATLQHITDRLAAARAAATKARSRAHLSRLWAMLAGD